MSVNLRLFHFVFEKFEEKKISYDILSRNLPEKYYFDELT
jgi:hypothetical protein